MILYNKCMPKYILYHHWYLVLLHTPRAIFSIYPLSSFKCGDCVFFFFLYIYFFYTSCENKCALYLRIWIRGEDCISLQLELNDLSLKTSVCLSLYIYILKLFSLKIYLFFFHLFNFIYFMFSNFSCNGLHSIFLVFTLLRSHMKKKKNS